MNWVNIGSGNGLSPVRRQAITWTNVDFLSIGPLGTNFSEIWIKIQNFSFVKMHLKISFVNWRPFCPGGVNWTLGNKFQWNVNENGTIFIGDNAFENDCKISPFLSRLQCVNSSPPGQNGCHFSYYAFKCIFMKEKFCILIPISLKFVPKGAINSKLALVQVVAWRRTGDKPLPELMLT